MQLGDVRDALRRRPQLIAHLLLALTQVFALVQFASSREVLEGLPLDDAWIHQVVARTFAKTGTLGYAAGQHGAGATSYLWAAILAVNFRFVHVSPALFSLAVNVVGYLLVGQGLLGMILRSRPQSGSAFVFRATTAVMLASLGGNFVWFVYSGMEAIAFAVLSIATIVLATREAASQRALWAAGVLGGLAALSRPEAIPLIPYVLASSLLWTKPSFKRALPLALPWLIALVAYFGSNFVFTGNPLPATLSGRRWMWLDPSAGLSRGTILFDFVEQWCVRLSTLTLGMISDGVFWWTLGLSLFGLIELFRQGGRGMRLLLGWAAFHLAFYVVMMPSPGHGGRYQPFVPFFYLAGLAFGISTLVARAVDAIVRVHASRVRWLFLVAAVTPFFMLAFGTLVQWRRDHAYAVSHIQNTELKLGEVVNRLPPDAKVASFDIGGIGYASERTIQDIGGLSDKTTATMLAEGRIAEMMRANRVDYIVLPMWYDARLPDFTNFGYRLHLFDNAIVRLEPFASFETPLPIWGPGIAATWNSSPRQVVYRATYTESAPRMPPAGKPTPRVVADPSHLLRPRDATLVGYGLGVVAQHGLDLALTVEDRPTKIVPHETQWAVHLGPWGIDAATPTSLGSIPADVLRAAMAQHVAPYIELNDLAGAAKLALHVCAWVEREWHDPSFQPHLAALNPPFKNGRQTSIARTAPWGFELAFGTLLVALLLTMVLPSRWGFGHPRMKTILGWLAGPARSTMSCIVLVTALFGTSGCHRDVDLRAALDLGDEVFSTALAHASSDDLERRQPLLHAATLGRAHAIRELLARGASRTIRDEQGGGALHVAAGSGHLEATQALLHAGFSVSEPDTRTGKFPLHWAVTRGTPEVVELLLRRGADVNARDQFGETPLHALARLDHWRTSAMAPLLLASGADLEARDIRGFTPLHVAAGADNLRIVDLYAARPQLREAPSTAGLFALDLASSSRSDRVAERLLVLGAKSKRPTVPPLHEAALGDDVERADKLLASGVDLTRMFNGKTALDFAREHKSTKVERVLLEYAEHAGK